MMSKVEKKGRANKNDRTRMQGIRSWTFHAPQKSAQNQSMGCSKSCELIREFCTAFWPAEKLKNIACKTPIVAMVTLTGCMYGDVAPLQGTDIGAVPIVPKGFKCVTTPSEAYSPGYIYRVDSSSAELLVNDRSDSVNPNEYRAGIGVYEANLERDVGITASLLKAVKLTASSNLEANMSAKESSKVSFRNGTFLFLTDGQADQLKKYANKHIKPQPDSSYYIVRDAVRAEGIDIELSDTDEKRLGGEASIKDLVSLNPNATSNRDQKLTINGSFSEPLNVCIRVISMNPKLGRGALSSGNTVWELSENFVSDESVLQKIFSAQ